MQTAKHSLMYFVGRVLPAAVGFGGIALYTRLLDPVSIGSYALLLSISMLAASLAYGWLRTAALRVAGSSDEIESVFAATVLLLFSATSAVVVLAEAVLLRLFYPSLTWLSLGLTLAAALTYAWFDLTTTILQARRKVLAYGASNLVRSVAIVACSLVLIRSGLKQDALLAGFAFGCSISLGSFRLWRAALSGSFDSALAGKLLRFGWPSVFSGMALFTNAFQRSWLTWTAGAAAVGSFSVANDFSSQTVGLLIGVTALAGRPLAFRAADLGDPAKLASQLRENARIIFAVALPSAIGLAVLASPVCHLYLGPKFRSETVVAVIALASVSALIAGLRDGYFEQAFEITFNIRPCAVIDVAKVVVAVGASIFLIRPFGAVGATVAALVGNAVGLGISIYWGRLLTTMPIPFGSWLKTALATIGMVFVIELIPARDSVLGLLGAIVAGASTYLGISALTRFSQTRAQLRGMLARSMR